MDASVVLPAITALLAGLFAVALLVRLWAAGQVPFPIPLNVPLICEFLAHSS